MSRKRKSVQNLFGLETFGRFGLKANKYELVYFRVQPTNISVLSEENIDTKIHQLMLVLSMIPDLEINCLDSCECFDGNKVSLQQRMEYEDDPAIRDLLKRDMDFLDDMQIEMSTAREFMFCARMKDMKDEQIFQQVNRVTKAITEHGFDARRMSKQDIKRMMAIYFEVSMNGDVFADIEGEQFMEVRDV